MQVCFGPRLVAVIRVLINDINENGVNNLRQITHIPRRHNSERHASKSYKKKTIIKRKNRERTAISERRTSEGEKIIFPFNFYIVTFEDRLGHEFFNSVFINPGRDRDIYIYDVSNMRSKYSYKVKK